MNVKHKNLLTLVGIAALFLAPIVASYYLNAIGWKSGKTKNRGHLLSPPVAMKDVSFELADGSRLSLDSIRHTWSLLYVGGNSCDTGTCMKRIDELNRVHIALGKNQKRVNMLYLNAKNDQHISGMLKDAYEKFNILGKPLESVTAWKTLLGSVSDGQDTTGMVFIIDPLGNVIMYYRPDEEASGIRKDMGRLLHVSRVG